MHLKTWLHWMLRREIILYAISVIILGFIILSTIANPLRINWDVAAQLTLGKLIINGAVPYVDYIENNPPLSHYIHTIPVIIGNILHISSITVFSWLIIGLIVWTGVIISFLCLTNSAIREKLLIGSVLTFTIAMLALKLFVANSLGQREHIFILLFLPYFSLRWMRINTEIDYSKGLIVVIGILAGIGICLKPHFLMIWFVVELYVLVRVRSKDLLFTPEFLAVVIVGVLYGLHFIFISTEMREGLVRVSQLVLSPAYGAYGDHDPIRLVLNHSVVLSISLLPFVLFWDKSDNFSELFKMAGLLTLISILIVGLQGRDFYYHWIPAWMGAYLIVFMAVFGFGVQIKVPLLGRNKLEDIRGYLSQFGKLLVYGLLFVALIQWGNFVSPSDLRLLTTQANDALASVIEESTEQGDYVLVISTEMGPFRSVLQAERELLSKYIPATPIPYAYYDIDEYSKDLAEVDELPPMIDRFLLDLKERIRTNPKMVIIDNKSTCQGCPNDLNLSSYLSDLGFLQQNIEPNYVLLGEYDKTLAYLFDG